jgi:uncharacterized protein YigE (DUF2233 family)
MNPLSLHTLRKVWLFLGAWVCSASFAQADDPPSPHMQITTFHDEQFVTRTIDPRKDDLRLFLNDDQGKQLSYFTALDKYVSGKGGKLIFAANAGMFDPSEKPVGLLVQNGKETSPINLDDGTGNFFMKPNGIFLINDKHEAMVIESSTYAALLSPAVWATQSGPLLVHGGNIHPDFNAASVNKKIRSGVGVTTDGLVIFALSQEPVTFYDFAFLFLSKLNCPNALYLDGEISQFYVPGMKGSVPFNFGPMFGLVEKQ